MTIAYCPRCQREVSYNPLVDTDIVHNCDSNNSTLDNDDYVDYSGNCMQRGEGNGLWGTRAGNDGAKSYTLTSRGNKTTTTEVRAHNEFIRIDKGKILGEGDDG